MTIVSDALLPPTSEDDGFTSGNATSTKIILGTEGEGFTSDVTWEELTWEVKGRHVLCALAGDGRGSVFC